MAFVKCLKPGIFKDGVRRIEGEIFDMADGPDKDHWLSEELIEETDATEPFKPEAPEPEEGVKRPPRAATTAVEDKEKHDEARKIIDIFYSYNARTLRAFERENRHRIPNWPTEALKTFLERWKKLIGSEYEVGKGPTE